MSVTVDQLKAFKPTTEFFIGIDSDGCVFDSMEIKQKECFCPHFINHMDLQPVAKYAREAWEFVNLYSKTRGINRFPAIIRALSILAQRKAVQQRGVAIPALNGLSAWINRETSLSNPTLKAEVERNPDPDLCKVLAWSVDVNEAVKKIVRNVPPFPYVKDCLVRIGERADSIVVSQTPSEALQREWAEHGLDSYVRTIAGQELGTKTQHIAYAAAGKYPLDKMLMIGDAPGDLDAAKQNGILFFPINPGFEEDSWRRLREEGLDKFFGGTYAGEYEAALIKEFSRYLPENPPWQNIGRV
jgi:phosphoglycolate phosphatase-like HAD superfamily hydrolase